MSALVNRILPLLLLTACPAHRPPDPAPAQAACITATVAAALIPALTAGITSGHLPPIEVDASACGPLDAVDVPAEVQAAVAVGVAVGGATASLVADPCAGQRVSAAAAWAGQAAQQVVGALSSGVAVVRVDGAALGCAP